jgi:hypothetical protein
MKMSLADIYDRYTICILRIRVGRSTVNYDELGKLQSALDKSEPGCINNWTVRGHWLSRLLIWNSMIWANEAAIRDAQKVKKLSIEEVGRRALAIRKYNRERMRVKREIAEWAGETFDVKVNHASE